MAKAYDVLKLALKNRKFREKFLENQTRALRKYKIELSKAERKMLSTALKQTIKISGRGALQFLNRAAIQLPPPPAWPIWGRIRPKHR